MADNSTKIVITAEDRASLALKAVTNQFDGLMSGAGKVTAAFTALTGLSFAGMATSLGAMVRSTADVQDEMGKMAQKAGMTVEAFSGLGYAAKLAGADTETLVKASKALSGNIIEAARAGDQSKTIFGALGIAVKDAAGGLRATDQILLDVAGKFAGMEDGAKKSALAVQLFGKSGLELVPFLNQGKEGIQALTKEAEKLGIVVSGDAARASEKFNDNLERLSTSAEGLKRSIGNAALPMLNELAQQFVDAGKDADSLGNKMRGAFTRGNIEEWAQKSAYALAFVIDSVRGVAAVWEGLTLTIGAALAQTLMVAKGNLQGAVDVGRAWKDQLGKAFDYTQARDKTDAWFEEYGRTVRINGQKFVLNNKADAERVQAIYDKLYEAMGEKSDKNTETDKATLKKREELREKYFADERARTGQDVEYAKQKIKEKYEAEINAMRGADDEARLVAEIRKKMEMEVDSITSQTLARRIDNEALVVGAVSSSAAQRVAIEKTAAEEVKSVWNEANAVKAGQTGGVIANQGTPGEFVSSWDKNGNYVGDLGKTVSGSGALNKSFYTSNGSRQLSVQEAISVLNGYGHYATGGSFMVGGSGGTDTTPVGFMATPGEKVTIQTPAQQRASGATININVSGGNPQSIIAAIRQALRTDPNLLTPGMARAG